MDDNDKITVHYDKIRKRKMNYSKEKLPVLFDNNYITK